MIVDIGSLFIVFLEAGIRFYIAEEIIDYNVWYIVVYRDFLV